MSLDSAREKYEEAVRNRREAEERMEKHRGDFPSDNRQYNEQFAEHLKEQERLNAQYKEAKRQEDLALQQMCKEEALERERYETFQRNRQEMNQGHWDDEMERRKYQREEELKRHEREKQRISDEEAAREKANRLQAKEEERRREAERAKQQLESKRKQELERERYRAELERQKDHARGRGM